MKAQAKCMSWNAPLLENVETGVACVLCGDRTISVVSRLNKVGRLELQVVCRECRDAGSATFFTSVYKASTVPVEEKERYELKRKAIKKWKEMMR